MKTAETFYYHLNQLQELLVKAAAEKDPAMWLLKNNARTPVFMMEALCKLYKELDEKTFSKLKQQYKALEDGIGKLDYYVGFENAFKDHILISDFIKNKITVTAKELNTFLLEEKWISKNFKRIKKTKEKLESVSWPTEKEDVLLIDKFYKKSILEIETFYKEIKSNFSDIENQLHELRRKLRWLSIYPHAVRGTIQLHGDVENPDLRQYITEDVLHSPFNTFPEQGEREFIYLLNKAPFLAVSWMISSLGNLKDEGLRFFIIKEAGITLAAEKIEIENILQKATLMANEFFNKKVLEQLVYKM